ncbi:MAG: hypothetical protein MUE88_09075 [Flavobacteriales bacterium]|jgi:hypothetical protein|nr:hypothetical protein [Flavobacteriales bacterium]
MNAPSAEQRLNPSCILLYGRLLGLPAELLGRVRLFPRDRNWLHAPWYGDAPGGAMVLAEHIYLSRTLYHAPQGRDRTLHLSWLLLMAHELVHVRQARSLSPGPLRPLRFGVWAGLRYARSFLRHGRRAYAEAAFEREAESGRDALKELLTRTGGIHPQHPIVAWCMEDRQEELQQWLAAHMPG